MDRTLTEEMRIEEMMAAVRKRLDQVAPEKREATLLGIIRMAVAELEYWKERAEEKEK